MKIKLIIMSFLTVFCSSSCMSSTNLIEPSFNSENGSESYFVNPIIVDESSQFSVLFKRKWYFTADLKHKEEGKKSVNDCRSLTENIKGGFTADKEFEYGYIQAINVNCRVWNEMSLLTKSKISYLSSINVDRNFSNQAPPEFSLIISKDDERRLAKAKSWQEMSHIKNITQLNDDQAIYYDNSGGIQKLTLMAKGDYNQDGIEDAVLYMENSVEGGSYSSTHAYIITRLTAKAPYTLLKKI